MKNKFIILTLCFTIIFSNINLNNYKSYANNYQPLVIDGGVISAPMVATVATLAVASGIALSSDDDVYDIVKVFYEKHKSNWEDVQKVFDTCVSIGANKVVTVGKEFLDLVKDCFDSVVSSLSPSANNIGSVFGIPYIGTYGYDVNVKPSTLKHGLKVRFSNVTSDSVYSVGNISFVNGRSYSGGRYQFDIYIDGYPTGLTGAFEPNIDIYFAALTYTYLDPPRKCINYSFDSSWGSVTNVLLNSNNIPFDTVDIPYVPGSYAPGGVLDKDNVGINVPSNVGDLVGAKPGDILGNPSYDLPSDGSVTLPGVSNPSLDGVIGGTFNPSLDTDVPGDIPGDIPSEGLFASIKDFIISLVVPSDTFWTDTFNGFRDNFSKNFPMLDMSKFDSLAVGGKPFPNLYAYGSKIVDGDVINSIVDWLRPIIAGFIMICLMFFNYRKIYKLIRNTEPFGGIAQGSSDFRTGLSAPPINNGLDSNPMGNLRDTLFDMRNEILRRENGK